MRTLGLAHLSSSGQASEQAVVFLWRKDKTKSHKLKNSPGDTIGDTISPEHESLLE